MVDGVTSVESARRQSLRGEVESIYTEHGSDTDQADEEALTMPRYLRIRREGHAEYAYEGVGKSQGEAESDGADAVSFEYSFRVLVRESAEVWQVAISMWAGEILIQLVASSLLEFKALLLGKRDICH